MRGACLKVGDGMKGAVSAAGFRHFAKLDDALSRARHHDSLAKHHAIAKHSSSPGVAGAMRENRSVAAHRKNQQHLL
jgi:hypothetical protein